MKRKRSSKALPILFLAIIVLAVGVIVFEQSGAADGFVDSFGDQHYQKPQVETVVEKVEVIQKDVRIEAAQEARRAEVEAESQAAYDDTYDNKMTEIKAEVLREIEAEIKAEREEAEKAVGIYWRDQGNVKRLIRDTFPEAPNTAVAVAMAESKMQMIPSRERYKFTDTSRGIYEGQIERSYCIFQIHDPDHGQLAESLGYGDYDTNVESCVAMARVVYEQRGHTFKPWSVYTNGSYMNYVAMR